MDFRIVHLPPFTAATSGADCDMDFSESGKLGKFNKYFSSVKIQPRDDFSPRDFLFFNKDKGGFEWWWALTDDISDGGFEHIRFDGGYYLTYFYKDGDGEENDRLYSAAMKFIADSEIFELDERPNHYAMGHIISDDALIGAMGFAQMETFIPVKLK